MNFRNELLSAAETVASNPKVSAGVSAVTTGLGVASATEWISGPLSSVAILAGIIATVMLARVHWETHKNQVLQNKILRKELIKLGGDPDADE
jgi:hypothetical protein